MEQLREDDQKKKEEPYTQMGTTNPYSWRHVHVTPRPDLL